VKGDEVHEWGDADYSQLATTCDGQVGRGDAPVLHREHEGAAGVRTRPVVSCCELIDLVQATEYRVCDNLSAFPLRRRPSSFRIARCPLSDRSMRPPMIEVRNVRG
jgi:hypothetical protein